MPQASAWDQPAAPGAARHDAAAFEIRRRREAADFGKAGEEIDELHQPRRDGRHAAGRRDEQRDAGGFLEETHLVPEAAVLAEMVAVIAVEDDDRAVPEFQAIQRVEEDADLRVHEADAG